MPNWCENKLMITGPAASRRAFLEIAMNETGEISFEGHSPTPAEYPALEEFLASTDRQVQMLAMMMASSPTGMTPELWYLWRCREWGTKWDLADANVQENVSAGDDGAIRIDFLTAWSPPVPWLATVAAAHPDLNFRMVSMEPANDFACVTIARDGVMAEPVSDGVRELRGALERAGYDMSWLDESDDD